MNSSTSNSRRDLTRFALGFAVALFALFAASEVLLRVAVEPQDEFIGHAELLSTATTPDAAFGDSHVARGFLPPAGMVNLAYPSESIPQMAWKIDAYIVDKPAGRVILQADPHMFAPYRLGGTVGDYPDALDRAATGSGTLYIALPRYRANLVNYWTSLVRQGGRLRSTITFTDNGAHLSPGDISEKPMRAVTDMARTRIRIHDVANLESQARYRQIYTDMLDGLAAKGAEICLVTFPQSPDYREALEATPDPEADALIAFFREEAARVSARHVDWRARTDDRSDFRDTDHLNGAAAQRLSPDLMQDCFSAGG